MVNDYQIYLLWKKLVAALQQVQSHKTGSYKNIKSVFWEHISSSMWKLPLRGESDLTHGVEQDFQLANFPN